MLVPEFSVPPIFLSATPEASRTDLCILNSPIKESNGSCLIEYGHVKCLAVIRGPAFLPRHRQNPESAAVKVNAKFSPFGHFDKRKICLDLERDLCHILGNAVTSFILVHKYPNTEIKVHIYVLEWGGDFDMLFTATVLATSNSLVLAGIEIKDTFAASTAHLEEGSSKLTLVYSPRFQEISQVLASDQLNVDQFARLSRQCIQKCIALDQLARDSFKDS